ncbi:MAG TPA: GGDEF domain-containing protein [Ilumatobacteraceae bacterium]|nr:GGDEF domain-containing protein [Ilumatobacteraceae bacterium]
MDTAAQRAFNATHRKAGQFTLLLDENFDILWHCESLTAILGWTDLAGRSATEFVHTEDLGVVLETMLNVNQPAELYNRWNPEHPPESADIRVVDVNGTWRYFEATTYTLLDDPAVNGVLCTCKLISDRSDIGRAIELLGSGSDVDTVLPVVARLADHCLGMTTRCAFAWQHGARTLSVTAGGEPAIDDRLAAAAALVWSLGIVEPITFTDLDDPRLGGAGPIARDAGFLVAYLVPIEAPTGPEIIGAMMAWSRSTVEFKAPPQSPIHVALRLAALAIADSRTKRDLRWAAAHDPLTGLVNRTEFARKLETISATADIVLLYIDLDDFKPINDTHGHAVGDAVLIEVGRRVLDVIGERDVVGRLGGDEFAVICAETNDPIVGRDIADRIVRAVREPIRVAGVDVHVGASVGVAVGAQPLIPAQLMQRADDALYLAKTSGKNTVRLAS